MAAAGDRRRSSSLRPRRLTAVTFLAVAATFSGGLAGLAAVRPGGTPRAVGATRVPAPSAPHIRKECPAPGCPTAGPSVAPGTTSRVSPSPSPAPAPGPAPPDPHLVDVTKVEQLTGPGSLNGTGGRWDVFGADLGHMFFHQGALYMVFGDTFGPDTQQWRSNTMARLASPDPRLGLRFESMVTDATGAAGQLLGSLKVDGVEKTVIPTNGVSVGGRMFLHYMSVRRWGAPGSWQLNYSGWAYSDDAGQVWVKDPLARWPGDSNFGQVAIVPDAATVYLFGIPGGRHGGAQLARVPGSHLLDMGAYEYWDGNTWSADRTKAATVVASPVGELSVRWSAYARRWLMMYLDESRSAIVLRTASNLTGPWGPEKVVATAAQFPELYAPYMVPVDTGPEVYFTMSQYGPYEVFLMKASLEPAAR